MLANSVEGPVSIDAVESRTGATRREIASAIGDLRTAGLLDEAGSIDHDAIRAVATAMPSDASAPVEGPWTGDEAEVLARFFDGDRLLSIPGNATKRRLVIEKIALRFEPGVRYHERDVNFVIQLIHPDYAAVRRYLIDEGFMDRADGSYWRSGGRHDSPAPNSREPLVLNSMDENATLRSFDLSMAAALVESANDERVPRYMGDRFPHPYTDDDAYEWITFASEQEPQLNFAVIVDDRTVGGVGLAGLEGERTGGYEIGWWLTPEYWGRGITTAVARRLLDYAFSDLGGMYVFAPVMHPNTASSRVARKIGMTETGRHPSAYLKGGVRYDEVVFSITRSQWSADR